MKKILIILASIFAMLPIADTYAMTCDQQFYGVLRYGNAYRFNDFIDARNNSNIHYIGGFDWRYTEQHDYNLSSSFPNFSFTQQFLDAGAFIYPGDNYKFVEADSVYTIRAIPATRSRDNLKLEYITTDFEYLGNGVYADPVEHVECVNYEISWCGDGVIEAEFGETCDPNAPGFDATTCSAATCQPIAQPTCEGLSANPISGLLPTDSEVVCAGNLVSTWEIDCGNGQVFTGTGNNGATEQFRRTCNYTSAGTFTPTCTINGNITSPSCQQTVTIQNTNPSILIDKTDANSNDLDGNIGGNDTQTINRNTDSVFRIRVTNNGNEDLTNLVLTDTLAPQCAGSVQLPNIRPSTFDNFSVGGAGNNADSFLQPGEFFEYTCTRPNTPGEYVNTARVEGNGRFSNGPVNDSDTSAVILAGPSITINKTDANPANDLDGNIGNDTQTVTAGDDAVFRITVRNDGEEDLTNIVLTDANGPACAGSVQLPNIRPSGFDNFSVFGPGNNADAFLQPGESFSYTCTQPNTQADYTNIVRVNADGRFSNDDVSDTNPTQVLLAEYDLALRKTYSGPASVVKDDNVTFNIEVINQGEVNAANIEITDYIPNGLTLNDANWTLSGSLATRDIAALNAGTSTNLTITFSVDGDVFDTITNFAEISRDNGQDCDSTPDQNNSNDGTPVDNAVGTGCEPGGDEDDHDLESINVVRPTPDITLLKFSANPDDLDGITDDSNLTNDTQSVLIGSGAIFKIVVENTGTEDLEQVVITDALAPACNRTDTQTQALIALIGNTDNVFNPGEVFEYECSLANTQASYTNSATVNAVGTDTNTPVDSTDTTQVVVVLTPSIAVDKIDNKVADLDGVVGNDSQTINLAGTGTFTITVTNNGTEDLQNVVLTDIEAPACNRTDTQTQALIALVGNNDSVFNVGEVFSYDCDDSNILASYTNTIVVTAVGVTSTTPVSDDDTSEVVVQLTPSIAIDKIDNNTADLDTTLGNDTQTVTSGSGAIFRIRVSNDGTEDLRDIVLTDVEAPACAGSVTLPSGFPVGFTNVTLSGSNIVDGLLQPGEFFEYDCVDPNITADYINSVTVDANGNTSGTGVTATDTSVVVVSTGGGNRFDLALRKTLDGTTTVFATGSVVTFNIEIFNQGQIGATDIEITDYIPAGLTLTGSTWTQSGSLATQTIASLPTGTGTVILPISFVVDATATGTITNTAEISADNGDDCDSTTDQIRTNDAVTDDDIGAQCINNPDDEDDHDIAIITIGVPGLNPSIEVLKFSANQADTDGNTDDSNVTNDSQRIIAGGTAIFKIVVTNNGNEDLNNVVLTDALAPACNRTDAQTQVLITAIGNNDSIFNVGESFTYNCNDTGITADYTNSITVTANGVTSTTLVTDTDTSFVDIPGGGGGGGTVQCSGISVSGNQVTCLSNLRARSYRVDCDTSTNENVFVSHDGTNLGPNVVLRQGRLEATLTCATVNNPICYVAEDQNLTSTNNSDWVTDNSCRVTGGGGGGQICGDNILQPSNNEQCDDGNRINGDGCSSSCTIETNPPGGGGGGTPGISTVPSQTGILTFPLGGELIFDIAASDVVLGDNMDVDQVIQDQPFFKNASPYEIYIDSLCLVKQSGTSLEPKASVGQNFFDLHNTHGYCEKIDKVSFPGEKILLQTPKYEFITTTEGIPGGVDFQDNIVAFTMTDINKKVYNDAYFAGQLKVRVAKPSLITTGGTAFFEDSFIANLADIADGIDGVDNDTNNFGGVVISDGSTSGDNAAVNSSDANDQARDENNDLRETVITDLSDPSSTLKAYNGNDNIFIINGTDLKTSTLPDSIEKSTTFIVENANLIVDADVNYDHNVGFIVRGGNVIVNADVENMDGSYVAIPKGVVGGKINGTTQTNTQLIVNGSLYGDTKDLIAKRSYVQSADNRGISVGTIVSFGSSFFRDPAPLLGKFISEYTDSVKVAQ